MNNNDIQNATLTKDELYAKILKQSTKFVPTYSDMLAMRINHFQNKGCIVTQDFLIKYFKYEQKQLNKALNSLVEKNVLEAGVYKNSDTQDTMYNVTEFYQYALFKLDEKFKATNPKEYKTYCMPVNIVNKQNSKEQ